MWQHQPRRHQRFLGNKGTPQHERHEIVAPQIAYIGRFVDHLAITKHPVPGQVGANVSPRRDQFGFRIARLVDFQDRAGFRVFVAEVAEFSGKFSRQDDHVGLNTTQRMA
jgi:hypothetical protein